MENENRGFPNTKFRLPQYQFGFSNTIPGFSNTKSSLNFGRFQIDFVAFDAQGNAPVGRLFHFLTSLFQFLAEGECRLALAKATTNGAYRKYL